MKNRDLQVCFMYTLRDVDIRKNANTFVCGVFCQIKCNRTMTEVNRKPTLNLNF